MGLVSEHSCKRKNLINRNLINIEMEKSASFNSPPHKLIKPVFAKNSGCDPSPGLVPRSRLPLPNHPISNSASRVKAPADRNRSLPAEKSLQRKPFQNQTGVLNTKTQPT